MRCPLCDVPMREVERRGVLIDVCPECRGVWLDRGELDKLLAAEPEPPWEERPRMEDEHRYQEVHRRKKKSWLSELFDFDFGD